MTRIFADNIGVVSIHEKDVAIPANIEVSMGGNAGAAKLDPNGVLASGFSCFITSFSSDKKSQYQLKQSLDHKTHIIPFGEAPERITLTGVTFGYNQINAEGKGSAGVESGKGVSEPYRLGVPEGAEIKPTAESVAAAEAEIEAELDAILSGPVPEAEKPSDTIEIIESWIDDGVAGVNFITGKAADFKAGVDAAIEEIMESDLAKDIEGLVDKGLAAVDSVLGAVEDLMALPGDIVDGVMTGLGLKASKADAQNPMRRSRNSQFFPLSFPELNLLFTHMHLGSTARVASEAKLYINYCGVRYSCAIDSMRFQSDKTSNSINFSMSLIGVTKTNYYPATMSSVVNTKGKGPSTIGKLLQTFGGGTVNKVINANPQIGGSIGSEVSAAKVTVGRLQG